MEPASPQLLPSPCDSGLSGVHLCLAVVRRAAVLVGRRQERASPSIETSLCRGCSVSCRSGFGARACVRFLCMCAMCHVEQGRGERI